jgi:hypothetical protein
MSRVVREGKFLYYITEDNNRFALPVIDMVPFTEQDRLRALDLVGQAYYAAHELQQEPTGLAYFVLRYEAELRRLEDADGKA